jgi:hypothetical protein
MTVLNYITKPMTAETAADALDRITAPLCMNHRIPKLLSKRRQH